MSKEPQMDTDTHRLHPFMEKLLDGAGVEWKALRDVLLKVENVNWLKANRTFKYIDLSSVDRALHIVTETIDVDSANHPSRAQQIVKKRDVIFGTTRPMLNRFAVINDELDGEIASTGFAVLRPNKSIILSKFLYFSLTARDFMNYVDQNQKGAGYPAISDSVVKKYLIPIPCPENPEKSLKIQAEIVRILDAFTELNTELTTRRKQYEYYRDLLLSFPKPEEAS